MKVLAFADCRTSLKLPDINPDLVLLLGDIPAKMVSWIDHKYECTKVGVFGNHDTSNYFKDSNIINVHEKVITIDGLTIAGFEGSPQYKVNKNGQHTEDEASKFVSKLFQLEIDIFLAHSNPVYLEQELDNAHRGFKSFNSLLDNQSVRYFFHGHLHDPFEKKIHKTKLYSVYPSLELEI